MRGFRLRVDACARARLLALAWESCPRLRLLVDTPIRARLPALSRGLVREVELRQLI